MNAAAFTELLQPGETVLAHLAGEGRRAERGNGMERTWWHVALTRERMLVIQMRAAPGVDRWEMINRLASYRSNLRFSHFPRVGGENARLTIEGCGEPIVFIDVDRPPVLQQVAPFLAAWGGPVRGGESVAHVDPDAQNDNSADTKKFLLAAGVLAALFFVCCGCLGVAGVLRQVLGVGFDLG